MSKQQITVAQYINRQLEILKDQGISARQVADQVGFPKPNVISMIRQGLTKLPLDKVPAMARALHVDPVNLFRMVFAEYQPKAWEALEPIIGEQLVSKDELKIIEMLRNAAGGALSAPETVAQKQAIEKVGQLLSPAETEA